MANGNLNVTIRKEDLDRLAALVDGLSAQVTRLETAQQVDAAVTKERKATCGRHEESIADLYRKRDNDRNAIIGVLMTALIALGGAVWALVRKGGGLVLVGALLFLCACAPSPRDRQVANCAASTWEAAQAIAVGVPPAIPVEKIQRLSAAIITAMGCQYPAAGIVPGKVMAPGAAPVAQAAPLATPAATADQWRADPQGAGAAVDQQAQGLILTAAQVTWWAGLLTGAIALLGLSRRFMPGLWGLAAECLWQLLATAKDREDDRLRGDLADAGANLIHGIERLPPDATITDLKRQQAGNMPTAAELAVHATVAGVKVANRNPGDA